MFYPSPTQHDPKLHNVKHNVFLCGIGAISITTVSPSESDKNTLPLFPKTSSVDNSASVSPATPTRAASRKLQTVQEIAADIGATAQVMSREEIGGAS